MKREQEEYTGAVRLDYSWIYWKKRQELGALDGEKRTND